MILKCNNDDRYFTMQIGDTIIRKDKITDIKYIFNNEKECWFILMDDICPLCNRTKY